MASKTEKTGSNRGFTLIEIIATIAVSAILAVLLSQVMQGYSWRSYLPLEVYDRGLALQEVMEEIAADYRNLLTNDATPLATLRARITSEPPYYWHAKTFGPSINVEACYCFNFVENDPGVWVEGGSQSDCSQRSDTLLKVTLSYENRSLTDLFAR